MCRTCRPLMSSYSSRTSIICHSCKLASLKQCTRWQKLVQSEQRNPCCVCCYGTWPEAEYTIHPGTIPFTYQRIISNSLARRAFPPHDINKSTVSYIEWTGYFRMVLDSGKIHCLRWLILEGTPERMSSHSWQLVRQIVIRLPVNQYMNRCSVLYLIYIMLSSIYVHSTVCTSCRFRTDTDRSDKPCPLFSEPVS